MKKINNIIKITLLKNYRIEENEIFFSNKINNKKITKKHKFLVLYTKINRKKLINIIYQIIFNKNFKKSFHLIFKSNNFLICRHVHFNFSEIKLFILKIVDILKLFISFRKFELIYAILQKK